MKSNLCDSKNMKLTLSKQTVKKLAAKTGVRAGGGGMTTPQDQANNCNGGLHQPVRPGRPG